MYPLGDPPDYEPKAETSIAARAAREGRSPEEVAYDLLLERDGKGILYLPVTNYAGGNLDVVREMIAAPNSCSAWAMAAPMSASCAMPPPRPSR